MDHLIVACNLMAARSARHESFFDSLTEVEKSNGRRNEIRAVAGHLPAGRFARNRARLWPRSVRRPDSFQSVRGRARAQASPGRESAF